MTDHLRAVEPADDDTDASPDRVLIALADLPAHRRAAILEELAEVDALPRLLTREEAWTFFRFSESTLDRTLDRGDLERRRIGGTTYVTRASIRAWVLREAGIDLDDRQRPRFAPG